MNQGSTQTTEATTRTVQRVDGPRQLKPGGRFDYRATLDRDWDGQGDLPNLTANNAQGLSISPPTAQPGRNYVMFHINASAESYPAAGTEVELLCGSEKLPVTWAEKT